MKKAQFTKLSKYEDSLKQAKAGYYRALPRTDIQEMAELYKELGYLPDSLTCNRCILAMLLNLAKEFDNYKNKHTTKDETSDK